MAYREVIWACAILTLAAASGSLPGRASSAEKPNFVVINVDDLGYADIGPFGSKNNRTPHLDQMAREGRRLTCFYAAPVCSPSRAALMTGCYPKRALGIPHVLFPANDVGLASEEVTVAELLREQGYATGIIGKWHLGDQPEFLPTRQGFDYYYGLPYSNDMGPAADGVKSNLGAPLPRTPAAGRGQPPLPLLRNETVLQRVLPDDQRRLVENYTEEAIRFLQANHQRPFFLYLPHSAVHFPLYPSPKFTGTSQGGLHGDWVQEVDWSVGQVLAALRDLKLEQSTLVIFTSDNGGAVRQGSSNAPLRGGKGSTWEGGMREPTVAWWPGKIPAGSQTDAVTSMIDILPTLVALAGGTLPTDRKLDGADVWPLLAGTPDARSPHETFLYHRGLKLEAIRHESWKLHLASGELYDLSQDIGEASNVAADHPQVVAHLRKLAADTNDDLGVDGLGPGCRPLGRVQNAQPLINHDGTIREGFAPTAHAGQGILVGEVTSQSAVVQVRLTHTDKPIQGEVPGIAGVVKFMLRPAAAGSRGDAGNSGSDDARGADNAKGAGDSSAIERLVPALPEHDFIARAVFEGLSPGVEYQCRTLIGLDERHLRPGPTARFRTLPGPDHAAATRFVVVTGMNYAKFHGDGRIDRQQHVVQNNTELPAAYAGPDKPLGYPALETILKLRPDFFVGTGDNVYYDTPTRPRAKTVTQMRQKWHEQFVQPRYRQLFSAVPTYWEIDDHDYRVDDCDNTGNYPPSPAEGRQIMLEQLPLAAMDDADAKTYRTHRVSRDLQIWLVENRLYRSPNAMPDGPDKSIWGREQKEWLKRTLLDSDATFKLLISPTPMVGPDDLRKTDNHTNIGGFRHERDEFFAWLNETGLATRNFYLLCGDRHWQYHARSPEGIEEFSSGALVDANARLGRKPGDPKSTDPDAKIRQLYYQDPASGGFLQVQVEPAQDERPARLTFTHHDEHGKVLYRHEKSGK
ncbi:MAG: sulfatase-like hydrolase/transferase [Pirellulaceae bacterium]|nr:sulfatase-like hydrolase/transferase [Pirellulaceae bacterium]